MAPKAKILCSCGKKLKTEADLSAHLRDSPKHKKPLIKGNAAPNPVDLEAKSGPSALVKNMSSFHVVSAQLSMNNFGHIVDIDNVGQLLPASC
jgi:hypothetical protein